MPRNIQDIIPSRGGSGDGKKSIRDIPIPEGRKKINLIDNGRSSDTDPAEPITPAAPLTQDTPNSYKNFIPPRSKRPSKKIFWLALVALTLIAALVVMSLFSGATLSYTPKSVALSFNNESFVAHKTGEGRLLFSVVKLSGEKGQEVSAEGEEEVREYASGTIIIYNDATEKSQRLRDTTRFETPEGKVYQIRGAIAVPGRKIVNGQSEPGKLETVVYAAEPGEEYNIGLSDFTLPGFKGDSRYSKIYARSKTEMTSGFLGKRKIIAPDALAKAESELQEELRTNLVAEAKAQVPEDFILIPSISSFVFEDLPQSNLTGSGAQINIRGNFYGVMFKKSELANFLAKKKTILMEGEVVRIPKLDELIFSPPNGSIGDLLKASELTFMVSGEAEAVSVTDEAVLRSNLIGKKKSEVPSILKNYPTIKDAEAVVRPFWSRSFPDDAGGIVIKERQ